MSARTTVATLAATALLSSGLGLLTTAPTNAAAPVAAAASQCSKARNDLRSASRALQQAGEYRAAKQGEVDYWRKKRNDAKKGSAAYREASQQLARARGELSQADKRYNDAQRRYQQARGRVDAYC